MKIELTSSVLETLLSQGYQYVSAKVYPSNKAAFKYCLLLKPLYDKPINEVASEFEAYYDIDIEPAQMVRGLTDGVVYVELNPGDITALKQNLLKNQYSTVQLLENDTKSTSVFAV